MSKAKGRISDQRPTRQRTSRRTGKPTAAHIRRTWRLRPSVIVISSQASGTDFGSEMKRLYRVLNGFDEGAAIAANRGMKPTAVSALDNVTVKRNHNDNSRSGQAVANSNKNLYWRLRRKPELGQSPHWLLTAARIQRLQDAGFVFSQVARQPYLKFHEWKERLQAYKDKVRHIYVYVWVSY